MFTSLFHQSFYLNNRQRTNKNGFSLLELLVVISIIGILLSMGAVAFSTVQRKGRDGRRRSDIEQIQKAFEQYYAENTTYAACNAMAVAPYMLGGLPVDPKPDQSYTYGADNCSATAYCICATLEDIGAGNANAPTDTTCNYASGGDYYCKSNFQ